jgi:hypothetical protein
MATLRGSLPCCGPRVHFNSATGVTFNSLSAGNSGRGAQTVAHNVPWVTTVGASTYDGEAALVGCKLEVSYDGITENISRFHVLLQ